jgi:hypothetical protein
MGDRLDHATPPNPAQRDLTVKPRQNIVLQSVGGSLRLPLFQNGACPFPCTPLLSVLMLVTQTDREVLTMCPGLRIMAVSMSGLEIVRAGVPLIPADVVNLQLVIMLEEQPTIGTARALLFEQRGQSGTDPWVASPSGAPIDPIPLVRTPMACDLGVPEARNLTMGGEIYLALRSGRRGNTRRASHRGQYRSYTHPAEALGCRLRAQWRSFTQVR